MANAKRLIRQYLQQSGTADAHPAPLSGRADPTLMSGASEYLTGVTRPDRSTLGPNGNRVHDLESVQTRKRLNFARRSPSSPLGASESGGFYL